MRHYVYRITNIVTDYHYPGCRSAEIPEEDIGIKYFSSSTNKLFIQDQKNNPDDYKYKIVYTGDNRKDAISFEVKYHKRLDVKNHPKFLNKANQTSSGFDTKGSIQTLKSNQKRSTSCTNTKISRAKTYYVYDKYDSLMFSVKGNFQKICNDFDMPYYALWGSRTSERPIYTSKYSNFQGKPEWKNYQGWYLSSIC